MAEILEGGNRSLIIDMFIMIKTGSSVRRRIWHIGWKVSEIDAKQKRQRQSLQRTPIVKKQI